MDLVRHLTTVAQYENYCIVERGPSFKMNLYEKLGASTIDLVHISSWDKTFPLVPRIYVNVNALSNVVKEVRMRSII